MGNVDRKHSIHNFLSRTYDNMSRRCRDLPTYKGKLHITRHEFIDWGKQELPKFMEENNLAVAEGYTNRGISIDKIKDHIGYKLGNLRFMMHKDNATKGTIKQMVKVAQYDLDGNLVATYDSMADAGRAVGGSYKRIADVINGLRPTMYGFVWKKLG